MHEDGFCGRAPQNRLCKVLYAMSGNQVISLILKENTDLVQALAFCSHVWVVNTPKVRSVCLSLWSLKDRNGFSLTHFNINEISNEKANLKQALDSIEVHHSSAFGALDWSEIKIYADSLTGSDISELLDSREEILVKCSDYYKVIRKYGE